MATLKEVAKEAGVSTSLVSQYLTQNPTVRLREETRRRIDRAVETLGYRPSAVARSLRRGSTRTLGLVLGSLQNRFFALLADLVLRESRALGYQLLIGHCESNPEDESAALRMLLERQVDGCFQYLPVADPELLERLRRQEFPMMMFREEAAPGFLSARRDYGPAIAAAAAFIGKREAVCVEHRSGGWHELLRTQVKCRRFVVDPGREGVARLRELCRQAPETLVCYGWATTARLIRLIEAEFPGYQPAIITNIHFDFPEMRNFRIKGAVAVDLPQLIREAVRALVDRVEGRPVVDVTVTAKFLRAAEFPPTFNREAGEWDADFY